MRVGLIVNPIAGAGGQLAMHGSDSFVAGAEPPAHAARRAAEALDALGGTSRWLCAAGAMGEALLRGRGIEPEVVGSAAWPSGAADTHAAAAAICEQGVELLLFAGGDGTARDVMGAVGDRLPVLGIPAGVKLQSSCFGTSARAAGRLARAFLDSHARPTESREVVDLDEAELAQGRVAARLHGLVRTPVDARLLQGRKSRSLPADAADAAALAAVVAPRLSQGVHLIGPGSTTWALKQALGLNGSLIGVDIVEDGRLAVRDATEVQLWACVGAGAPVRLWLTAIGGQGHVIGRGNAPLSPRVLRALGRDALTLLLTRAKLQGLGPLRVDSGDADVDEMFNGPVRAITGPLDQAVLRLVSD